LRSRICAANWKMHKNPQETRAFLSAFLKEVTGPERKKFIFFVPALNLEAASSALHSSGAGFGVQNVFRERSGAFTGENSPETVAQMGATHTLVGHSERRQLFNETDEDINKKLKLIQELNMTPMLCLGETWPQREAGATEEVIVAQLNAALKSVDTSRPLILAYEPVWAIGTGKVATPEQANEAHQILRQELNRLGKSKTRSEWGDEITILYGGSVKADNAAILAAQSDIDGFLVGGASLDLSSLLKIHHAL
jgi:triosephosphate isomerase